jgi:hypothetical protein
MRNRSLAHRKQDDYVDVSLINILNNYGKLFPIKVNRVFYIDVLFNLLLIGVHYESKERRLAKKRRE